MIRPVTRAAERVRLHRLRRREGRRVVTLELLAYEIAYLLPDEGERSDAEACSRALGRLLDRIIPAPSPRL
jgi:hypothetical protein